MIRLDWFLLFWIFLIHICCLVNSGLYSESSLHDGRNHVCKETWYERQKYKKSCSFWKWGRCTAYRNVEKYRLYCCDGWSTYYNDLSQCNNAICDNKINPTGACNIYYSGDYIKYRSQVVQRHSGGSCSSPNTCTSCNDGFYSDGPYCRICPAISYCYHRKCTAPSNNQCMYCHGEIKPQAFWRAYTPDTDNKKSCQQACSWRSDSTRCYPGRCSNELSANCQCVKGYTGTHCEIMTEYASIVYNEAKLEDTSGKVLVNPTDPNTSPPQPEVWTNVVTWHQAYTNWAGRYLMTELPPTPDPTGNSHYVTEFKYGIKFATTTLTHYRGGSVKGSPLVYSCPGVSELSPVTDNFHCIKTLKFDNFYVPFQHDDTLRFTIQATIGGYVRVMNREASNRIDYFSLVGTKYEREYVYHWDTVTPYHCVSSGSSSCPQFVTAPDLTEDPSVTITWDGWADDLSQLNRYNYELYDLGFSSSTLSEQMGKQVISSTDIALTATDATFTVPNETPGMYSLHFSAFDNAGNWKTARKVFLFDDESVVSTIPGKVTRVITASSDTNYLWVVQDTNVVTVQWLDRFANIRHENYRWLNQVDGLNYVDSAYDDQYGDRTINRIDNVHALVDFQVSFNVHDSTATKDSRILTSVSNIHDQGDILTVNWADGDQLNVTVRGIDVLDKYTEEMITVYRDATPPLIEDLWLTRGDMLNVSVHRLEDFQEMTIEWIAYDYHSGIDSVYWRLFDNFTNVDILHGHEDILAQGSAPDLATCNSMYGSYARGANCYCTQFWGCYHQHFQVKPEIKSTGGLLVGKDMGLHDSDYYIEISVTSKAQLTTVLRKKITIDTSPPHTGIVHDGLRGNPELDYQQSLTINGHWDGFFDRESGVLFYQYSFGTACTPASSFALDISGTPSVHQTYSLHATHTATAEGTYYLTVVAFNRALEASVPVCSDGITIDTSTPSVKEVGIEGARITGGLVTDSAQTTFWVVGKDRMRRLISNPTADCTTKATAMADVEMLPLEKYDNNTHIEVDGSVFCANTSGAPATLSPMLSKSSLVYIEWLPVAPPGGIHDYELGLSSTAGSAAPDILSFRSTMQNPHIRIMHADVPDSTLFYIIIKTISKSGVEGIQTVGPCFMDTTKADFTGTISVTYSNGYLIASWSAGDFSDPQEPYELDLQFAIGHEPGTTEVNYYRPLQGGDICVLASPPTCTAIAVSDTEWQLHGNHRYYVTIKAENSAGLVTYAISDPYIHSVQLAPQGIVLDVPETNLAGTIPFEDIEDIDFTTTTTSLAARWSGFTHPHLAITYRFSAGTTSGGTDVVASTDVNTATSYAATGLSLTSFQTYYVTITAVTSAGSVSITTDGVTVAEENAVLSGIVVNDGEPCNDTVITLFNHHDADNRLQCAVDIDFQSSTNILTAYWSIPTNMRYYTPDAYIAVEERSPYGSVWSSFLNYNYIVSHQVAKVTDLSLNPGRTYRTLVKLCAGLICYTPLNSNGVTVLANPPQSGSISLQHLNTTQAGGPNEKLIVNMDRFYDPDVQDSLEKYDVMDKYEWAITDQSDIGRIHVQWTTVTNIQLSSSGTMMSFEITLGGEFDFSKCRKFAVRGYNKAKLYSVVSANVKDCASFDPVLVRPNPIIDAVGQPVADSDGNGQPVFLLENDHWTEADKDYTPYYNYISAVWPKLRYNTYTAAVLNARSVDVTTYYLPTISLSLPDPCSHPDALACATTDAEYINFKFDQGILQHGERYMVCIHTENTTISYETWDLILLERNICSDGVVVDLTPPTAGKVWIGNDPSTRYQISSTDMYVNWESFLDVEQLSTSSHSSGIADYKLGIGTSLGGNDMVAFHSVGVVNHVSLHNLLLQSGHTYYATIEATDFAGRTTTKTSEPVTVDTSPPVKTDNPITITGRHIVSKSEIEACWNNVFLDVDTGMSHYMWSIGSKPGYEDVMPFTKVIYECAETDKSNPLDLHEGHAYFISVKAFNNAGLMTLASSWAFIVDTTPPVAGHVYDSDKSVPVDLDFQTDMYALNVHWEGFYDPHTAIKQYFISIGTCPKCGDVLGNEDIGIIDAVSISHVHFGAGLTYYTTVTACNTADLCTSVTSDGVIMDNSPPSMGLIYDGTGTHDIEYQSIRSFIGAKWLGFTDPQSGLWYYEWCAGTTPGGNDIISETEVHLTEVTAAYNLSPLLPVGVRIYVTVKAYNRAGMFTTASSNGFIVDETAPVIGHGPAFSVDYGIKGATQFFRTSMKVEWTVYDTDSHIERQFLSVKSHQGGEFDFASTAVNGIARDFILTGLNLHDGVTYYVNLISCNGAQICSSAVSNGILVDSTPPNRGMFAIHTDHAAELERHISGWMTWSKFAVYLAWLGFADLHSQIDYYYVTIGKTYMAADLNEVPDVAQQFTHDLAGEDKYDEGLVQKFTVKTSAITSSISHLYISIWAVNKVGLSSPVIHSKFEKIPGGTLSLVRRCSAESCFGHCVCAPQDQLCHTGGASCNDVTIGNPNNLLSVGDRQYGSSDMDYTSTNVVLQGSWSINLRQGSVPLWYQWSVGYTSQSQPEGIFSLAFDRVWHDARPGMIEVFTTAPGTILTESVRYSFFVRAWYSDNTYADFKSDGVVIATLPPTPTNIQGSSVSERMFGSNAKDQDYMKNGFPFTVDWTNKFVDASSSISEFRVYLSTTPGGHDVYEVGTVMAGTTTSVGITQVTLTPNVKYYSNVIGYGLSGIHHTESSDGFYTDKTRPVTGMVYDGIGLHDLKFQNSSEIVAASWHGFTDVGSGITSYVWCVGYTPSTTECQVRDWENVGLQTSVSRKLNTPLYQGQIYFNKVFAVDSISYTSSVVVSDGFVVDVTPPIPQYLVHMDTNLLQNPSFETSKGSEVNINQVNETDICSLSSDYHPDIWTLSSPGCCMVVSSDKNLARQGRTFTLVRGSFSQTISSLTVGELYRLEFYSSHLLINSAVVANKEGFAELGDKRFVFLLYTKAYRNDDHGQESRETVSWHKHTFYFIAKSSSATLSIGSVDMTTGVFLDDLSLQQVQKNSNGNGNGAFVSAHVVYLHEWGSVHASWDFIEDLSPITDYTWAIGYQPGGTQIQGFESIGQNNFAYNSSVILVHNAYIYITVVATNTAGLRNIAYSDPLLVDLTPPNIKGVYDGRLYGEDQDAWTENEVCVNWEVEDLESGLDYCEWSIGYQPQGIELQAFENLPQSPTMIFKDFDYSVLESYTIFTTVRCHNKAGLSSFKSSDGVKISNQQPSIAHAVLQAVPQSVTEYQAQDHYQSMTDNIRLKWSGFTDNIGVEQYKLSLNGGSFVIAEKMAFPVGQSEMVANIMYLNMVNGQKNITSQAVNTLLLVSDKVESNVTVFVDKPVRDASRSLALSWHTGNLELTVSWVDVFSSPHPIYYEISAGQHQGGADILQWQESTVTSVTFGIPPTVTDLSNLGIYVFVRAVAAGGLYEDISGFIRLPP